MQKFLGVIRYEYQMAILRKGLLVIALLFAAFYVYLWLDLGIDIELNEDISQLMFSEAGQTVFFLNLFYPVIAGGLSAYGFLADNALELQFTTKHSAWRMIFERLGIIMSMICVTSLSFQIIVALMNISLAPLGGIVQRQLVWFIPCMTLLVFGGSASLMTRSCSGGFALVGGVWIIQLLLRGWFAQKPILRNILLFLGAMDPLGHLRIYNQLTLTMISLLLLAVTYTLPIQQEKYI